MNRPPSPPPKKKNWSWRSQAFRGLIYQVLALALIAAELLLLLWLRQRFALDWLAAAAAVGAIDLVLAGLSLRLGGHLLRGPYLPETTAGLLRTTRALTGRD